MNLSKVYIIFNCVLFGEQFDPKSTVSQMAWWTVLTASVARTQLAQSISCALLVIIPWTSFCVNNRPAWPRPFTSVWNSSLRRTAYKATLIWTSTPKGKIDQFFSYGFHIQSNHYNIYRWTLSCIYTLFLRCLTG